MKKLFKLVVSLLLVVSMSACSTTNEATTDGTGYKEGTYEATVKGHNADLTVAVTLSKDRIEKVEITNHQETPGVSDMAIEQVPADIVEYQSLNVDLISGASVTSQAIIDGTAEALGQAGVDVEALKNKEVTKEVAEDEELTYDVAVIGGGGAGLAAAIEAGQNGASVLVIEKMPKLGGNTLICGSGYNAVDPERQGAMGIEDSIDLFYEQTIEGGDNEGNPELVRIMVEQAYDGIVFLEQYGMEWQDEISTAPGGLYQRRHMPANGALGVPMINALEKGCEENGVEYLLNTKAYELIMDGNKVVGVKCEGESGNTITVNVNKGVVLATGGFSANVEMREEYNTLWPTLDESVLTTNHPGATGDGIEMAKAVGADLVDMQFIQLFPYGDPNTGAMTGSVMKQPENAVYLNKEGLRFVNEYERRDVVSAAVLEQTDAQMFVVVDGKTYENDDAPTDFGTTIGEEVAAGRCVKGETIEELAKAMNMDPAVVQATIDEYNAGVEANNDKFGKTTMNKIDTAPYYANLRTPTVHHTMGGVKINTDAQVINTDGEVIEGLYAAGEVTGDIHGTNRVGANALPDIIVFGRIAGENVSK
ncbi:MAG: flavocytochrome c [Erysipelotrichaceae bacterium]|nr:flavocytochrome c [Erysipelotrichaceae bacterium]MDY5251278.1 flavocytochrome c [Erysipelotrichaceae bacterium]